MMMFLVFDLRGFLCRGRLCCCFEVMLDSCLFSLYGIIFGTVGDSGVQSNLCWLRSSVEVFSW